MACQKIKSVIHITFSRYLICLLFSGILVSYAKAQQKTVIEIALPPSFVKDSLTLEAGPLYYVGGWKNEFWQSNTKRVSTNKIKWELFTDSALRIVCTLFDRAFQPIVEPGDSIHIAYNGANVEFSGRGHEKWQLLQSIESTINDIPKPNNPHVYTTRSVEDYIQWHQYLNKLSAMIGTQTQAYGGKISASLLTRIKASFIANHEFTRLNKFMQLKVKPKSFQLTLADLRAIYDSTLTGRNNNWLKEVEVDFDGGLYIYSFIRMAVNRAYNFSSDSLDSESKRRVLYYDYAKKHFKGIVLEKFLTYFLKSKVMQDVGFSPEMEKILSDYYSSADYPEEKAALKKDEATARMLQSGYKAPEIKLYDTEGKLFSLEQQKGITIIDFWFTGCKGCIETSSVLRKVKQYFAADSSVQFVSISIDEDSVKWKKSIVKQKYTIGSGINLYTEGMGAKHPVIRSYNFSSYPTIFLIDRQGNIVEAPLPNPAKDSGKHLIALINQQLAYMNDGPYVFNTNDKTIIKSIEGESLKETVQPRNNWIINVGSKRLGAAFTVQKKLTIKEEPSVFGRPDKLMVISDIEGNFAAFTKLLIKGGVIDKQYNWTFSKGHLVLNGDFFDRGVQVTECLWLIYSLESKAKAKGGYVHYILGNHEIMNLNGDHRYVSKKYEHTTRLLKSPYSSLFGKDTELGLWLRSKNIVEKIGELLFVHGGISEGLIEHYQSIERINHTARKFYDHSKSASSDADSATRILFDRKYSPFWLRTYYLDQEMKVYSGANTLDTVRKTTPQQLKNILQHFNISRIITGHSIVADTVSVHFDGKVINTDTPHARGLSEALLIEEDNFYRVNDKGQRFLLFKDEKNKHTSTNKHLSIYSRLMAHQYRIKGE